MVTYILFGLLGLFIALILGILIAPFAIWLFEKYLTWTDGLLK